MASIGKPTKKYNVYNQLVGQRETRDSAHAPEYYENPEGFYAEIISSTRMDVECVSNNNPIDVTITGEMKDL